MNLIVVVDENWGIGRNNGLLAHIPEDLKYFKEKTLGKTILMGRKTLESFPGGKPLAGRTNMVLTKSEMQKENVIFCKSITQAAELLKETLPEDIFVAGGESIYEQMMPMCQYAYVTKLRKTFDADKHFPNLDELGNWNVVWESDVKTHGEISFQFFCYENQRPQREILYFNKSER